MAQDDPKGFLAADMALSIDEVQLAPGLLEIGQRHLPLEIKASQTVTASDASPIERWIALNPKHGPGIVLYLGEEYLTLSANVRAVPAGALFGAHQ